MISVAAIVVALALIHVQMPWWAVGFISAFVLLVGSQAGDMPWLAGGVWLSAVIVFGIGPVRRRVLSAPLMRRASKQLPELSETEREALQAGDVGLEAELLCGRPQWPRYRDMQMVLSDEERAFIDGPVETVCAMVDDWHITHELADLPVNVWHYLKTEGFFGLAIPSEYGGKGFSAVAQSEVLVKLYSASATLGVTVAVPNSLGPGELLHRYGTQAQKAYFLPRLVRGEDIPCFALTSPDAGSDASAILDEGVVCFRDFEGESVLGIELTFDKRYITLAPIATLIGLAFKLKDPDGLLGGPPEVGVTCALVPRDTQGIEIGRRHYPLNIPFHNGPIRGDRVFVPLDAIIGGRDGAGKGWQMLVECLSAGRGISLPSGSTGAAKVAVLSSGAYARIRHQFGMPIAEMEGVKDSIARQVAGTVVMDATRRLVAVEVDHGRASGIAAAIAKYHVTEIGRQVLLDAMDVHGGKAIMLGPRNYLARAYQGAPISITVEGANILTRSLMIFGQGAIRCHPFLLEEMAAIQRDSLMSFDDQLREHIGWSVRNLTRAFLLALWCGSVGRWTAKRSYYRDLERFSAALAVLTDVSVMLLGASLKRRQSIGARLGDLLSHQYMAVAVLTDAEYEYRSPQYRLVLDYILEGLLLESDRALQHVLRNFPNRAVRVLLTLLLRPLARRYVGPTDESAHAVADLVTKPGPFRANLARGVFHALEAGAPLGRLEQTFADTLEAEPLIERLRASLDLGKQFRRLDIIACRARAAGLVDDNEFELLQRAAAGRLEAISVDDFDPVELSRPHFSAPTGTKTAAH